MTRYLILWPLVIIMVAAAIVDDILIRRTLDLGRARSGPDDASGDHGGNEGTRAKVFGSAGNNERILGVLQSLYRFG